MPARYARGSARAALTPPRPEAARTPLPASDRPPGIDALHPHPRPHGSLAPESRPPPEFRSQSPPPRTEIRGRAASGFRSGIALSGRLVVRVDGCLSWPALPAPSCPRPPPLPGRSSLVRTLPTCHREPPGCRACPVRGPRRPGSPRAASPLLRVFVAPGSGGRAGRAGSTGLSRGSTGPGKPRGAAQLSLLLYFQGIRDRKSVV